MAKCITFLFSLQVIIEVGKEGSYVSEDSSVRAGYRWQVLLKIWRQIRHRQVALDTDRQVTYDND